MSNIDYHQVPEPEGIYHLYNHAVGHENLFRQDKNYIFFLKQYSIFIKPVADTYSYCLLPNHFHLAVKFKNKIDNNNQFKNLIHYIHYNPVRHGFVKQPHDWKFSSYHAYISEKKTQLNREQGLKLFDSIESFHKLHRMKPDYKLFLNMDL